MSEHPVFSVIIPCFNEEEAVRLTHARLTQVMFNMQDSYELLYVNDGSRDHTGEILDELCEHDSHVRALHFSHNRGHQIAVRAGIDHARGDAAVIIDADLQDPPELIPEMAKRWRAGAQVVSGQRRRRAGETAFKKLTASLYYRAIGRMTGGMIPPDTGDFRLVDRAALEAVKAMPEHNPFLRGMFAWVGFKQESVLYDRDARVAGHTHYPFKKMLRLAMDGVVGFSMTPLRLSFAFGCAWTALGLIGALALLILTLCGAQGGLWWLAALISILGGNILCVLGVMGEYLSRALDEGRGRPLYYIARESGAKE